MFEFVKIFTYVSFFLTSFYEWSGTFGTADYSMWQIDSIIIKTSLLKIPGKQAWKCFLPLEILMMDAFLQTATRGIFRYIFSAPPRSLVQMFEPSFGRLIYSFFDLWRIEHGTYCAFPVFILQNIDQITQYRLKKFLI